MSVKFHLPGLRNNFPLNMLLVDLMEKSPEMFREGIKIASMFGEFPTSRWNGGRFNQGDQCNASQASAISFNLQSSFVEI